MFNTIMIVLVLLCAAGFVVFWVNKTNKVEVVEDTTDPYTIAYLIDYVNNTFNQTLRRSLKDMNLSRAEFEKEESLKRELRSAIRQSSIGDSQAKRFVKASILGIICNGQRPNTINEMTIDRVIPFTDPDKITIRDKWETMLYIYQSIVRDKNGNKYGADGIKQLFKDYKLNQPLKGTSKYIVTDEDINDCYLDIINKYELNYDDKKEILAQRIFEDLEGFGPVDLLLDTSVDEVEGGVSGIPMGSYEFKNTNIENMRYSYESIWIVMSGLTIHLDFLSFGTQDELVRVCNNIYKYDAPNVMSRTMGKVVATMRDGSRIVVVRPPFADSYAFLARKFDSAPSIAPEDLLKDKYSRIMILMLKWLIKGSQNMAITGDQGTGKTTMLKALIRFIPEDYTLRIQELTPELNIRYAYPDRNVMSFRETDSISSQEGLDLQKKTSGTVNIIGEVATAEAASWIIQTAKVASKMSIFTHHAKTVKDLIEALRNNMMQVNNYTDNSAVDEMIATSLNIDLHLERKKGHRFIGRVTEIIPIRDRSYPYDVNKERIVDEPADGKMITGQELQDATNELAMKNMINEDEYRKRITDRILFRGEDLIRYNEDYDYYEFLHMPTDEMIENIRQNIPKGEEVEMERDFAEIKKLAKEAAKYKAECEIKKSATVVDA